jgi:hypothetical protein
MKENLPLTKFSALCNLQKDNGLSDFDNNKVYKSPVTIQEMESCLAVAIWNEKNPRTL